jgi:DNA topoisomerase-3
MSKTLLVAEKPSVAQDLARVLPGPFKKGEGFLEGPEHVVTYAVGKPTTPNTRAGAWRTCR